MSAAFNGPSYAAAAASPFHVSNSCHKRILPLTRPAIAAMLLPCPVVWDFRGFTCPTLKLPDFVRYEPLAARRAAKSRDRPLR